MKIIKSGKDHTDVLRFVCKNCHCEFECNAGEYYPITSITCTSNPPQNECIASCPECHQICHRWGAVGSIMTSVTLDSDSWKTYTDASSGTGGSHV